MNAAMIVADTASCFKKLAFIKVPFSQIVGRRGCGERGSTGWIIATSIP